jgi:hypothetical protein
MYENSCPIQYAPASVPGFRNPHIGGWPDTSSLHRAVRQSAVGFDVALGGFAQPLFWFQLSAFSISAFASVWLWVAVTACVIFTHLPRVH